MKKKQKKLILFMPSMEGGGVEKNIILISNYLSKYISKITLITFDDRFNNRFNKKIIILNIKNKSTKNYGKYFKYFYCLIFLIKEILKNNNILVFSFQANIYCLILSFFFNFKIIIRSNASPSGWTKNPIKNLLFKIFFKKHHL